MKILVAMDGSRDAAKGAGMALEMAKKQGAEVTLVAVIPVYPEIDLEISARARNSLENKLSSQAEKAINEAKAGFQSEGLAPKALVFSAGAIADEIIKMAEEEKYDLIVIGSRGLGATGRFTLGGTAMKIIGQASCSVLVARAE
ncbi:MAG: universal stress protein [Thermodesulfobacteriota bacterium]